MISEDGSSFLSTFWGALQGTISVLLTVFAGYIFAKHGRLDDRTVRSVSKLCTNLFLPLLIIEEMGPELTASKIARLWIIPLWGIVSTLIAHGIGWAGKAALHLPYWTIVAAGRPNATALPLLLLQSLSSAGVLNSLAPGESASTILRRARAIILLNVVVQQTFTFQTAPAILKCDDGHKDLEGGNNLHPGPGHTGPIVQDAEHVGLLRDHDGMEDGEDSDYREVLNPIEGTPDLRWPSFFALLEKPIKIVYSYMSPPLIGAIIALFFGMIPALNNAFFSKDSALYTSVTQTIENLGELFVSLQAFTVGAELANVPSMHPGTVPICFVLLIRFIIMPALSLLFVWLTAGRGIYVDDPLVWFILILIPAGPSAMLLVNVAELVKVDVGPIVGYLTIAYMASPLLAGVCSLGLKVIERIQGR
ncbi:hypothetical protein CERSUDRAFT_114257 [Gelatoporia subvermispora B]|uniref:Auxin efflux carrier n=1 Tax=Ceriporiopsis subvermispora (strain B) TaxID=914234 RepID=M2PMI8_CERS8|nr:hypothetical protein CERSUDRAFT_114257 [Gelatoporia subvermispora B]